MRTNPAVWNVLLGAFLAIAPAATGEISASDYVKIETDFVADFDPGLVSNSMSSFASQDERSGRQSLPGVFLHPQGTEDAAVALNSAADIAGARAGDSDALQAAPKGWIYDEDLQGVILKSAVSTTPDTYEITW